MSEKTCIHAVSVSAAEIKDLRASLGMSQKEFAAFLDVSKPTVERWEVRKEGISGPVASLIRLYREHPELVCERTVFSRTCDK